MTTPVTRRLAVDAKVKKRKAITERMKVQSFLYWHTMRCCVCGERIGPEDKIDWDHIHPWALGGAHNYANITPLHRACHRKKTSGTKATSAGSDIHKIAKEKRIVRTQKFVVAGIGEIRIKPNRFDKPKRKLPKGRKFPKRPDPWNRARREAS